MNDFEYAGRRPWRLNDRHAPGFVEDADSNALFTVIQNHDDANLAIRAVNSRDELIAACELVMLAYGHLDDVTNPSVAACRAALAKEKAVQR